MKKTTPQLDERERSSLSEHQLNEAIEDLRAGRSPRYFSADPEFQAALRMHVNTSNTEIDEDFMEHLEEIVVGESASTAEPTITKKTFADRLNAFFTRRWVIPTMSAAGVTVIALAVLLSLPSASGPATSTPAESTLVSRLTNSVMNQLGMQQAANDTINTEEDSINAQVARVTEEFSDPAAESQEPTDITTLQPTEDTSSIDTAAVNESASALESALLEAEAAANDAIAFSTIIDDLSAGSMTTSMIVATPAQIANSQASAETQRLITQTQATLDIMLTNLTTAERAARTSSQLSDEARNTLLPAIKDIRAVIQTQQATISDATTDAEVTAATREITAVVQSRLAQLQDHQTTFTNEAEALRTAVTAQATALIDTIYTAADVFDTAGQDTAALRAATAALETSVANAQSGSLTDLPSSLQAARIALSDIQSQLAALESPSQ